MKTFAIIFVAACLLISCSTTKIRIDNSPRYCIVVQEVKHGKHSSIIRPLPQVPGVKKIRDLYRYPGVNISVGDTVDVSDRQLITGPRF
jgi:hypothetical protein